ncbi:MAG: aldehyde dehydrogenase family protein [Bdellovibrionota bacterium]
MNAESRFEKIQTLRQQWEQGLFRNVEDRLIVLRRMKEWIGRNEEKIVEALALDLSKPYLESYLAEIHFVQQEISLYCRSLKRWAKPKKVRTNWTNWPAKSEIRFEPYGVVLVLAPWNYPFQLSVLPMVCAIAAGNVPVLKPSEVAPHTASLLETFVLETCGKGALIFQGDASTAQELLTQKFDHIFYTGSTKIGQRVMEAASRTLTPVTLELGGKSPCIIDRDVDIEESAKRIVNGKFFNAGQSCVAPDYLCIPREFVDRWASLIQKILIQFYGSDPAFSQDYAAMISARHYERVAQMASEHSSWIKVGQDNPKERKLAPVVLPHVGWDHASMEEEIFGPLLPLIAYDNIDEVVHKIQQREKPLSLYVFSQNNAFVENILHRTISGSVGINQVMLQITNPNLPFGGVGKSGMGCYHGKYGFETFSHKKSVMRKSIKVGGASALPPYDRHKNLPKLLRMISRWC